MAYMNVRRFETRVSVVREPVLDDDSSAVRKGSVLRHPERVHRLFRFLMTRPTEEFHVALLNCKHRLVATAHVSTGTVTTSLVHPREVFRPALLCPDVVAVVVVHNHPSGDPEPSQEDLAVTKRLREAGQLLGVTLLDHVVIGNGRYVSLRDRMDF